MPTRGALHRGACINLTTVALLCCFQFGCPVADVPAVSSADVPIPAAEATAVPAAEAPAVPAAEATASLAEAPVTAPAGEVPATVPVSVAPAVPAAEVPAVVPAKATSAPAVEATAAAPAAEVEADNEAPVLNCPPDRVVSTNPNNAHATVKVGEVTAVDNSGEELVVVSSAAVNSHGDDVVQADTAGNKLFPIGKTVLPFAASDSAGNVGTCTVLITVTDTEPPSLACSTVAPVEVPIGQAEALVALPAVAVATDNSGKAVVVTKLAGKPLQQLQDSHRFKVGTTLVIYRGADESGNIAECTTDVIVTQRQDSEKPVLTCADGVDVNTDAGAATATVVLLPPSVSDNSGESLSASTTVVGSNFVIGATVVSFSATDSAGNVGHCSVTVTVKDVEKPALKCPSPITIESTLPGGTRDFALPAIAEATDNSGAVPQITILVDGTEAKGVHRFPVGTTLVTYKGVDNAGNHGECTVSVSVSEPKKLDITCPTDMQLGTNPGVSFATIRIQAAHQTTQGTGNVMEVPEVVGITVPLSVSVAGRQLSDAELQSLRLEVGVNKIMFSANDGQTSATCEAAVTVEDGEAPVLTCPPPNVVATDVGKSYATVTVNSPSVSDNSGENIQVMRSTPGANGAVTSTLYQSESKRYTVGTSSIIFTGTDSKKNSGECTTKVVVTDIEPPNISCPVNSTVKNSLSDMKQPAQATAIDNLDGAVIVTTRFEGKTVSYASAAPVIHYKIGINLLMHSAQDSSGNEATCVSTVTITPPSDSTVKAVTPDAGGGANVPAGTHNPAPTSTTPPAVAPAAVAPAAVAPAAVAPAAMAPAVVPPGVVPPGVVPPGVAPTPKSSHPPTAIKPALVTVSDTMIHMRWSTSVTSESHSEIRHQYQMAEVVLKKPAQWKTVTTSRQREWKHMNLKPATSYMFRVRHQFQKGGAASTNSWVSGAFSEVAQFKTKASTAPVMPPPAPPVQQARPALTEQQLIQHRELKLKAPVSISSNGGWLAFDCPLIFGSSSTISFYLWLVDDGSMQGKGASNTEAMARHVTQTARDKLDNVTPNLRVTRPKNSATSKFYLSGPRSTSKRSLQGSYSIHSAQFSKWVHIGLTLDHSKVTLFVDGQQEASYTVQALQQKPVTDSPENRSPVLFGSGDDFNGMSAIIDGVTFYKDRSLSSVELLMDKKLTNLLAMPATLRRPLSDTGPDLIFDTAIALRGEQLVGGASGTEVAPSSEGLAVEQSLLEKKLLAYYLVSHALGSERAHIALGHRHLHGIGVLQQCELAAHYYMFASEKGIDEMIQSNINSTRDVEFRLAETPSSTTEFYASIDKYDGILGEDDPFFKRMLMDASPSMQRPKGDPEAQYWLAKHYYWGRSGLAVNYTATIHYNKLAVVQEHTDALQFMGILYAKGHGVEVNHDVGLEYSMRAAAKGNLAAENTIGYYHERQGDYISALRHFKRAADGNNSYGHYNIALLYSDGLGTLRQDNEKALMHYELSAELGHPSCMLM